MVWLLYEPFSSPLPARDPGQSMFGAIVGVLRAGTTPGGEWAGLGTTGGQDARPTVTGTRGQTSCFALCLCLSYPTTSSITASYQKFLL